MLVFTHYLRLCPRSIPDFVQIKRVSVPMNVDYSIHRFGEWTMLMLGESVLSLLIVGARQENNYYATFYCGIITISLGQYLHFQSQPHHANDHAIRRDRNRGYAFIILFQIYSAALIILGASYKMMLYEYVYEAEDTDEDDGHRRALAATGNLRRFLAGGSSAALRFEAADRQQRIANFFCGAMATIWICSDMLILVHRGIREHWKQCRDSPKSKLVKILAIPLLLARVGLLVFMATLSQYQADPNFLALSGLVGVLAQVALRVAGTALYREETEEDHLLEEILKHGLVSQEFKMD
jgi:hypothetical protein